MQEVERVSPQEVRPSVQSGEALLVCAYEDEDKCRKMDLEGAITLKEFQSRSPDLPKDKEIVFYCA
jgi:rhodanese-related sulfurtransferase